MYFATTGRIKLVQIFYDVYVPETFELPLYTYTVLMLAADAE